MIDRQGIPERLQRGQVAAGIRSMGVDPTEVRDMYWNAEGYILVTIYKVDENGRKFFTPGTEEVATETLRIELDG